MTHLALDLVPVAAHGGTVGLALEIAFFAVPLAVFAGLAWWSGRKNREEEAAPDEPAGD